MESPSQTVFAVDTKPLFKSPQVAWMYRYGVSSPAQYNAPVACGSWWWGDTNAWDQEATSASGLWLIGVLGVAIVFAILCKKASTDPTLTAAPPIASTPGHPIVIHRKSPEVLALMLQQNGAAAPSGATATPAAKP